MVLNLSLDKMCAQENVKLSVFTGSTAAGRVATIGKKGDDAFVLAGFNTWKKKLEKFMQHCMTDLHKQAVLSTELMQTGRYSGFDQL